MAMKSVTTMSWLTLLAITLVLGSGNENADCKCIPNDPCWPSAEEWSSFNESISGKLLRTTPVAAPCYPLSENSASPACSEVAANFNNSDFQSQFPLGHAYYYDQPVLCDLPGGNTTKCELGDEPFYAVNASSIDDVVAGLLFANTRNLRVVVKTTGHDLMGRSSGFGSLEIWLRYLRQGVTFEPVYQPSCTCETQGAWRGAAVSIGGGYKWSDVYSVSAENKAIVVGGGSPDVGCLGGYLQGGGHSPATNQFGLGADQVLEAEVVLANGERVLASGCSNPELFRAIRGGGGGYGVVTRAKIKAFPDASVSMAVFSMTALASADSISFMDAVAIVYQAFPRLLENGLNGYGQWSLYQPGLPSLAFSMGGFNKTMTEVQALFDPLLGNLATYNGTRINMSIAYPPTFPTFSSYYEATNVGALTSSYGGALSSRFFGKRHLESDSELVKMLNTTAGTASEQTVNVLVLVGGNAVLHAPDEYSGLNPAWRETYLVNIAARAWLPTADYATVQEIHHDITYVKGAAMARLAPETGGYVNEGDWQEPKYLENFYGKMLVSHEAAKSKYDPQGLFYCNICVGSNEWFLDPEGRLCRAL